MALGILEPATGGHVSGTVLLDQKAAQSQSTTEQLKHGRGKDAHIILSPQPSEDPNDPLNWSDLKKNLILLVVFYGIVIFGVLPNPILNAGIVQIATELGHSVTDIAMINGYMLLVTAGVGPFASALGRKYGKRPVYVASSLLGTIGVAIGEAATGYKTLLAARIVQGFGVAAYEALGVATIGDLFFVHQRGPRVALIMFLLAGISNGISIIAGVITSDLGWLWNFHLCMPFAATQLIMVVIFCPETTYRRKAIYETDTAGSEEDLSRLARHEMRVQEKTASSDTEKGETLEHSLTQQSTIEAILPKKTFWQEMALYNGVFVEDSLLKMILACLAILLNVGAFYQIVSTGLTIAWYVAIAIVSGVIFASPPYLMSSAAIGYMSAGPLIGGLLGATVAGVTAEPFVKYMSRLNKGVYEPEFCLLPTGIGYVISIVGLLAWGYVVRDFGSIYLVSFIWALVLFGMTIVASFASQWALDAYRQHSTELFIMNMVFKNFFFYGLTNYIIQWYIGYGAVQVMGIVAGISGLMLVLLIPLWVYGKRYRNYWQHHNLIKILRLETDHTGAE